MFKHQTLKFALMGAAASALFAAEAFAGSFAIREQSAYSQGASFAGNATCGDSIQGMFWNPAAVTCQQGMTVEGSLSIILPDVEVDTTLSPFPGLPDPGQIGKIGYVPSNASSYQFNDQLYFGFTSNGAFGLANNAGDVQNGQAYFRKGGIFSLNVTPTIGYKINEYLSVAAGVQIQYFDLQEFTSIGAQLGGDDWGLGFTLGAIWKPLDGTEIGIGFRSSVSHTLEGPGILTGMPAPVPITAKLETPEVVTLSLRQQMSDRFTVLATAEWTNWSRLQVVPVLGLPAPVTFPFEYDDGWYFALGGEYVYNDRLTLRAGAAWEISPISDESRSLSLPDDDRLWLSFGGSYKYSDQITLNAGYTFITTFDTQIDLTAGNPWFNGTPYQADVDANVHIFSVGAQFKFGAPPPPLYVKG